MPFQAAFLAVSADVVRADEAAAGYASMVAALEEGLEVLQRLLAIGNAT